ncbi:MAG TPA: hypothetical protein VE642_06820 [Pyrinomonadaceae bacterium]|nr:hypothetical protein [Pyrinomonadaceae bacterium]
MYRPNFCCECGERVERARWRVWDSRRFCDACGRRFRRSRLYAPLALSAALACASFLAGRASRPTQPAAVFERGALLDLTRLPAPDSARAREARRDASATPTPARQEPAYGPDGAANERPTDPAEVVYICGARTKKGTPCSRRVRGPGRCWQHRGMPAILPPSKLVVPG